MGICTHINIHIYVFILCVSSVPLENPDKSVYLNFLHWKAVPSCALITHKVRAECFSLCHRSEETYRWGGE